MGPRSIFGLALAVLGGIWVFQGVDVLKGSPMTGVAFWAWAGVVLIAAGAALIAWDVVARRRTK